MRASFIRNQMPFAERKEAYAADITYGTNSEFGFDYLRDNMATSLAGNRPAEPRLRDRRRGRLDPHRRGADAADHLGRARDGGADVLRLRPHREGARRASPPSSCPRAMQQVEDDADYEFDEKFKTVSPRETAIDAVERALGIENLYDPRNAQLVNHLIQALKAESLYQRDVDYVVQDGEVKIVDEFTGRIMEGRRWSEGLHQAIEAKEGVAIREEHVTLATITLQNYFRLYEKLAGMTGTAKTEEKEFQEIYNLSVVEIPTNVPVVRADENDFIYKTADATFDAVIEDIKERHERGQPVLVGHDLRRGLRVPLDAAHARRHHAQRPEREAARARGRDHHGRGRARRGHDRHEHGRPRRRHQARRGRARARRPLRARHRAARGAPHRQPAARPLRPPGRPRRVPLLPLRPGRARPPLRRRPDLQDHRPLRAPRRRADGGIDPLEADRERPEEGRGAELRLAQERPQVRRRHERPAHGHLRAAPARPRGRRPLGGDRRLDGRADRAHRLRAHRLRVPGGVGPRQPLRGDAGALRDRGLARRGERVDRRARS